MSVTVDLKIKNDRKTGSHLFGRVGKNSIIATQNKPLAQIEWNHLNIWDIKMRRMTYFITTSCFKYVSSTGGWSRLSTFCYLSLRFWTADMTQRKKRESLQIWIHSADHTADKIAVWNISLFGIKSL